MKVFTWIAWTVSCLTSVAVCGCAAEPSSDSEASKASEAALRRRRRAPAPAPAPIPPPAPSAPSTLQAPDCDESSIYVAADGSDTTDCGGSYFPCATIRAGLATLQSGGTLCIGDGEYRETIIDSVPNGTEGRPTVVRAVHPNGAVLKPPGSPVEYVIRLSGNHDIVFDGLVSDAAECQPCGAFGFFPEPSNHIVVQNGTLRNGNGTYGSGTDGVPMNSVIRNMDIYHNGYVSDGSYNNLAHGIYFAGSGNLIDGNRISDNSAFAITLYSGSRSVDDNIVRNNVIFGHRVRSVWVANGKNNVVSGNTIYENAFGILVLGERQSVFDNVIYNNAGACIVMWGGTIDNDIHDNSCYGNGDDGIVWQ